MPDLKFEAYAVRDDGEKIYRLIIRGQAVREGMTLDEVIEFINRSDEDGVRKGVRRRKRHGHDSL